MPDFIDRFGTPTGPGGKMELTSSRQSIITSLLSAGTFVFVPVSKLSCCCEAYQFINITFSGSLGQAFTADRFGRKGSIRIWSVSAASSALLLTSFV